MRLEVESQDHFKVYVNNLYFPYLDWENREEIAKNMKKFILKLNQNYHLSLHGFYRATIYVHKKIGTFIEVEKIDDFDLEIHTVDLRIIIYMNQPFLIEVNDYFVLPPGRKVYFLDDRFYISVDDLAKTTMMRLLEMGNVIYGEEVEEIIESSDCLSSRKEKKT